MASIREDNAKNTKDIKASLSSLRQKVILLAEDDPGTRRLLKEILKDANFEFIEAANGRDALFKLHRHPEIDLGLIDFMMPKMTGIQLLNVVQRQEELSKIPFIMISAVSDQKTIIQCMKAGAKDFVVKPIDQETLIQKISNCLAH